MPTVLRAAAALVLLACAYAFLHDLFSGLPFTRSAPSWAVWVAGLFIGGLIGIALEGLFEWALEPDRWYTTGPRRPTRIAFLLFVLAVLGLGVVLIARFTSWL